MDKKKLIQKIYRSQYSFNRKLPAVFGDRYITYADYIASGQPLRFIEKAIEETVLPTYANTHTEASFTGLQTSRYREEAREIIKKSVNASDEDVLIFTGAGSTGAVDLIFRKLVQFYENKEIKPLVFIGPYEHHSNILPWREGPFELIEISMGSDGNVNMMELDEQLQKYQNKRPLIGSFSAASNVTGILSPVDEIHDLLKKYGALSFWDYAGAAPYVHIDMNQKGKEGKDAIFISAHKLIGGPGTPGILLAKKELFSNGLPVVTGGGTVEFVTKSQQKYFEDIEVREEAGTPFIIESIRAGLTFKLKDMVGAETIERIESSYIKKAIENLGKNKDVFILGDLESPRLGFMAFLIRYNKRFLHHNYVVALLNDLFGIQSRGGCSCAGPYGHDLLDLDEDKSNKYMAELGTGNVGSKPGWVRLNFNYFIPKEEFEYILECINWIADNGWKLLNLYVFDDTAGLWNCKIKKEVKLNYLETLITKKVKLKKGNSADKNKMRKYYLKFADKLAKKELKTMNAKKFQRYEYEQVDNPLRWYSLVQDIDNQNQKWAR